MNLFAAASRPLMPTCSLVLIVFLWTFVTLSRFKCSEEHHSKRHVNNDQLCVTEDVIRLSYDTFGL